VGADIHANVQDRHHGNALAAASSHGIVTPYLRPPEDHSSGRLAENSSRGQPAQAQLQIRYASMDGTGWSGWADMLAA
jgi:hypothetical protein